MAKNLPFVKTSIYSWLNFFSWQNMYFFNNTILIFNKTSTYKQNLLTHTSSYLPMHLQIVDFNCKNYNVKCGYCKWPTNIYFNHIQTHDDNKSLTLNAGIAIMGIFLATILYFHLDHLMQDVLNLIKQQAPNLIKQ